MSITSRKKAGESEGARTAAGDSPAPSGHADSGRFSSQRKLDALSRELQVTAARSSEWREEFLAAGRTGLKARQEDGVSQDEDQRMKFVIADLTMRNELLRERSRGAVPAVR